MISDILGFSMEAMGTPWDPMGPHGTPWGPMGTHGNPWEPMDFPWIFHELSGRPEADKKCGGCGQVQVSYSRCKCMFKKSPHHENPWGLMGTHGDPWGPMGTHGDPWGPMGTHGNPWVPWIFHGFSMNYRGGRRPTKNVGGVGGAGAPPTNSLGRAL